MSDIIPLYAIEKRYYNNETWFHLVKWSDNNFIVDPCYITVRKFASEQEAIDTLAKYSLGEQV